MSKFSLKIIFYLSVTIFLLLIVACSSSTPSLPSDSYTTNTVLPSFTPFSSPTSSTPQVPALLKITLEFYRNGKTYEIIIGYVVGEAFFYTTPFPSEIPLEKKEEIGLSSAEFKRYGDLDNDGESEFIVSLIYCGAYCSEVIRVYGYDFEKDTFFISDEFGAKFPAVEKYDDINNDGSLEIITKNYGFCYPCATAVISLSALTILRYENGHFLDVTTEFPDLIQQQTDSYLESAKNEGNETSIMLSGYLYNMYRLGKIEEARPIFEQVCASYTDNANCSEFRIQVEKIIAEFKLPHETQ